MTDKLNRRHIYHTYACKINPKMYCVSISSARGMCYSCKYDLSCPYSYMKLFRDKSDNVIKCMRYVPYGENVTRYVGLYFNEDTREFNKCFLRGRSYD